jgi:hypothetical protein
LPYLCCAIKPLAYDIADGLRQNAGVADQQRQQADDQHHYRADQAVYPALTPIAGSPFATIVDPVVFATSNNFLYLFGALWFARA